jgi:anti-sigma B factor antagonist
MNIAQKRESGALILGLEGKFDIEEASRFESAINEVLPEKIPLIALDMEALTYIDSSAIGSIIKSMNLVKNYGGELVLIGLAPRIRNIFELARLESFFVIKEKSEFLSSL